MITHEGISLDDIKNISESFNYLKNKDYDHAINYIKKVSMKCDELKQGKNRSNSDCLKLRPAKDDDFKIHLQVIGNKLRLNLENMDKYDLYHIILLYNYGLILHILKQNYSCIKILDKLEKYRSLMDELTQTQFILLRLDNYFNIQSPKPALRLIDNEFKEENKNLSDATKNIYENFQLKFYLQQNDFVQALISLEKLKKSDFSISLQFIEAHVLYSTRKLLNAMQCITSIKIPHDNIVEIYYWNNLGCIYLHLNKHNLGTMYFNRSLAIIENNKKNKSNAIFYQKEISSNLYHKVIHNLGVQLLFANKPVDAFDLLLEIVNIYPKNPRLWLRLAECCIKAYKIEQSDTDCKAKFVQNVVGGDKFKKIILDNDIKECKQPWDEVAAMPTPTLEFGSLCIRNALFLLPSHPEYNDLNFESKNANLVDWYRNQCIFVNPAGCIKGNEIIHLESSLLLNGAYISLCLNNNVEAYKFSEKLLHQPILSPNHKYLARMYMSEAMLMMNSYSNILPLLNSATQTKLSNNPEMAFDNNKEVEQSPMIVIPKSNNFPSTLEEAHSLMYFNLSVVHAILHQDKLVEQCMVEALKLDPKLKMSINFTYLSIYNEMRQGKTKNCVKILGDLCSNIPLINNIEV